MKNAGKHADALKALYKKLSREGKVPEKPKLDPIKAIVYASLLTGTSHKRVDEAMKKIEAEFVDFNELRVATELEVIDLLGEDHPGIEDKAAVLRNVLHGIFDRENSYKLDKLAELKKTELREYIRGLPMITPFVEAFVTMVSFDHSAVPIDDEMLGYLVDEEAIDPDATLEEAQAFLEQNIKGDDCWPFFSVVHTDALGHVRKTPVKKDEKAKKKS
ncbi:MAG: hypothetical protein QM770_04245 [Tepidisphaeraceae bacterium]